MTSLVIEPVKNNRNKMYLQMTANEIVTILLSALGVFAAIVILEMFIESATRMLTQKHHATCVGWAYFSIAIGVFIISCVGISLLVEDVFGTSKIVNFNDIVLPWNAFLFPVLFIIAGALLRVSMRLLNDSSDPLFKIPECKKDN